MARTSGTKTEQAFIDAATRLFAQKGYKDTSIGDLARELKLTTASLYYYVQGKQELLARVLRSGMGDFLERLEHIALEDVSPRERLRRAVQNHLDFVINNPDVVRIFFRYRNFLEDGPRDQYQRELDRYEELFTVILHEGVEATDDYDDALLRLATLGMINSTVEWYKPGGRLTREQLKSQLASVIMDRLLRSS